MTRHTSPSAAKTPPDSLARRLSRRPLALNAVATAAALLAVAGFGGVSALALDRALFTAAVSAARPALAVALFPMGLAIGVALAAAWRRTHRQRRLVLPGVARAREGTAADDALTPAESQATEELRTLLIQYYDLAADHELVLQTAADGIYRTGPEGRVVFANRSMATMLQRTQAELQGQNIHELAHSRRADGRLYPQEQCPIHNRASGTLAAAVEPDVMWRKDGSPLAVAVTSSPTRQDGDGVGAVVVVRDISRRQAAEAKHDLIEKRYRAIVETTPEWIWEMDIQGNYTYSNPAGHKIHGYTPKEIVGRSMLSIIHPDDRDGMGALLPALIRQKRGWMGYTLRWVRKDGGHGATQSNGVPILDGQGDVCGFRGEDRDVTGREATEPATTLRAIDLARTTVQMERVADIASHDLQEGLRLVTDQVRSLATNYAGRLGDDADESLHRALDGLSRMQELVGDVLSDAGQTDPPLASDGQHDVGLRGEGYRAGAALPE